MKEKQNYSKWHKIVKTAGFTGDNINKVSEFCQFYNLNIECLKFYSSIGESLTNIKNEIGEIDPNMLIYNLQIISKINDLNKVKFVSTPAFSENSIVMTIQSYQTKCTVPISDMLEITSQIGTKQTKMKYYYILFNEIADLINDKINEGNFIYMYQPITFISIHIDQTNLSQNLYARSRFTTYKKPLTLN